MLLGLLRNPSKRESTPKAAVSQQHACRDAAMNLAHSNGDGQADRLRCGRNFNMLLSPGHEAARCSLSGRQPTPQPGKGPIADCPMGSVQTAAGEHRRKKLDRKFSN